MAKEKDLVQIIRDNPGAIAVIDNDNWTLKKNTPHPEGFNDWTYRAQDRWDEEQELASSHDKIKPMGMESYQEGGCYGGDILIACAIIAGIKVESV